MTNDHDGLREWLGSAGSRPSALSRAMAIGQLAVGLKLTRQITQWNQRVTGPGSLLLQGSHLRADGADMV